MRISQVKFSHGIRASQVGLVKDLSANAGDSRYAGLIPGIKMWKISWSSK